MFVFTSFILHLVLSFKFWMVGFEVKKRYEFGIRNHVWKKKEKECVLLIGIKKKKKKPKFKRKDRNFFIILHFFLFLFVFVFVLFSVFILNSVCIWMNDEMHWIWILWFSLMRFKSCMVEKSDLIQLKFGLQIS